MFTSLQPCDMYVLEEKHFSELSADLIGALAHACCMGSSVSSSAKTATIRTLRVTNTCNLVGSKLSN